MGRMLWCALGALLLAASFSSNVDAQSGIKIRGVRPELHGGVGWHGDLGFGGRVDIPVAPNGFIDGVDDEFVLSPGGDIYLDDYDHGHGRDYDNGDLYLVGIFTPQWNFYVSPKWSIFPELGLALIFFGHTHGNVGDHSHLDLDLMFNFGARYHWSSRNSLVMRLSWPFGLQIGVTF